MFIAARSVNRNSLMNYACAALMGAAPGATLTQLCSDRGLVAKELVKVALWLWDCCLRTAWHIAAALVLPPSLSFFPSFVIWPHPSPCRVFSFFLRYFQRCLRGLNCSPALHLPPFSIKLRTTLNAFRQRIATATHWALGICKSAISQQQPLQLLQQKPHRIQLSQRVDGRWSHQHHLHSGRIQPSPICSAHNQHHQQTKNAFWPLIRCLSVPVSISV